MIDRLVDHHVIRNHPLNMINDDQNILFRHLGEEGHLFTDQNINAVYDKDTIEGILAYTAPTEGKL